MKFEITFADGSVIFTEAYTPGQASVNALNEATARAELSGRPVSTIVRVDYEVQPGISSKDFDLSPTGWWLRSHGADESNDPPRYFIQAGRRLPPPRLYKYQSPSERTFTNLASNSLWFADPRTFNDPFDCALDIPVLEMSDRALEELHTQVETLTKDVELPYPNPPRSREEAMEWYRDFVPMMAKEIIAANVRGVCCASERVDDLLMWGHYGGSHSGLCLEFDTSVPPFAYAMPVNYSQSIPRISLSPNQKELIDLVLTKAECWRYECEWRALIQHKNYLQRYSKEALTAVFCGAKMSEEHERLVRTLLQGTSTRVFKMNLKLDQFALEWH